MLSIGGNHTMHAIRRNVDLQILLLNNQIYGLTKGQYSPTSKIGTKSPSTPLGSIDNPVSASQFALGVGGTFIARSSDILQKHLPEVLKRADAHQGTSFVEIFQNCIVYNDGAFKHFTEKSVQDEMQVHVEHGQPLLFGKDKSKGLVLNKDEQRLEIVTLGENGVTEADIAVHDETNRSMATMLAQMDPPTMPVALGVLYCESAPTYEAAVHAQIDQAREKGEGDLAKLLHRGQTWTVE
jgi:2-oxoglutarate ferredoxin oxidoreductase subunit beta